MEKFARKKADCLRSEIFGIGYGNFRANGKNVFGNFRVIGKGFILKKIAARRPEARGRLCSLREEWQKSDVGFRYTLPIRQ